MQIDTLGEMIDFVNLREGELFYCNLDGPTFAMRMAFVDGNRAVPGVLSFSHAVNPTMRPMILDASRFNRSVLWLKNATFRPTPELKNWRFGVPNIGGAGAIMLGTGGPLFIRAWHESRCLDVDIVSGLGEAARQRPEQFWTDEWSIVNNAGKPNETVLLESSKPIASAAQPERYGAIS